MEKKLFEMYDGVFRMYLSGPFLFPCLSYLHYIGANALRTVGRLVGPVSVLYPLYCLEFFRSHFGSRKEPAMAEVKQAPLSLKNTRWRDVVQTNFLEERRDSTDPSSPPENSDSAPVLSPSSLVLSIARSLARFENEKDVHELRHTLRVEASMKTDEEEDDGYWQALAERTDAKSRFLAGGHNLVKTAKFDAAMGVVIVINSATIGMEADWSVKERDTFWTDWANQGAFGYLEYVFLVIYSAELALRFVVYGTACLKNAWVFFDAVLVAASVVALILEPLMYVIRAVFMTLGGGRR